MGRWIISSLLVLCAAPLGGCGAQQILLGAEGPYLFTVTDSLAVPGEAVDLRARLQYGDLLRDQPGCVMRFTAPQGPMRAAQADNQGQATVRFTPPAPGDYLVTVDVSPAGLPETPPRPLQLLVSCRDADAPMAIVDLDKTLVCSGFQSVLIGQPEPMSGSVEAMRRLADKYTIVYLTHRPELLGGKSRQWLIRHGYPRGPVLLSAASGLLKGNAEFKSQAIQQLAQRFRRIQIGIGDKPSDAAAYLDNGLEAFLIVCPEGLSGEQALRRAEEIKALPDGVKAVSDWGQIVQAVFEGKSPSRQSVLKQLADLAGPRKQPATGPK